MDKKVEIDMDLHSRTIGTLGLETMSQLVQMRVLIHGLRGLGAEIAKNIILAGPSEVSLHDINHTTISDLGANFFLTEADVNNKVTRADASINKLSELNPMVKMRAIKCQTSELINEVCNFDVIVITEVISLELATQIDAECRKGNKGFIWSVATGISGFCFVDYGENFVIKDNNGEENKQYIINKVTKENPGIVIIEDNDGKIRHQLTDGDYVTFKEVQGMHELNGLKTQIKWISPISFSICDTSKFGDYQIGGIVDQIKIHVKRVFKSLSDSIHDPYFEGRNPDPIDFSKFGRPELLHISFRALLKYVSIHNNLPELNDLIAVQEIVEFANEEYLNVREKLTWIKNSEEFNREVVSNVARFSRAQISPICAFLGGVVAQEVIKFTGKYSPISQWLWFDFFETIAKIGTPDRSLMNSRYDDQIAIFGREIQEKLSNLNLFMIGAGALGCEFLKDFAMMGISTKDGLLTVTDNDNIEISNLGRQFLFRRKDFHASKSKTACNMIKNMNSDFKCKDLQNYVSPETEDIFNDDFWKKQDFIINAVDNVKARVYIDNMCTWHGKNLIDSGTLGTKAHVQLIVPNKTSCYNDTVDPPEEGIPMCVLHNFPSVIEHCIEWGRDHFTEIFTHAIKDTQKLLESTDTYYKELTKEGTPSLHFEKVT